MPAYVCFMVLLFSMPAVYSAAVAVIAAGALVSQCGCWSSLTIKIAIAFPFCFSNVPLYRL